MSPVDRHRRHALLQEVEATACKLYNYFEASVRWYTGAIGPGRSLRRWKPDFKSPSQNKIPSAQQQWECTKAVLLVHFTVEFPQVGDRRLAQKKQANLNGSEFYPFSTDLRFLPPCRRSRDEDISSSFPFASSNGLSSESCPSGSCSAMAWKLGTSRTRLQNVGPSPLR